MALQATAPRGGGCPASAQLASSWNLPYAPGPIVRRLCCQALSSAGSLWCVPCKCEVSLKRKVLCYTRGCKGAIKR
jgi:hypothetical protein